VISIRGLYQQFRQLIHEGFKFLLVGGIGVLITIGGAVALHGLGKYVAVTIATIVATGWTYLGNRHWTFRDRQRQGATQESVLFFVLNGVGLLISYACIWIIQDLMGLEGRSWYTVALVVGTGLGTLFRFWSYRKWVWTVQQHAELAAAEFAGYAEPALVGNLTARPLRVSSSAPARRPPGRSPARHAAPRRTPDGRAATRGRSGAHRRS
jgi:putative flippase GtrA